MPNILPILFSLALLLSSAPMLSAQAQPQKRPTPNINPDTPLPYDPAVTIGSLHNGMRYYIRENAKPENRLELRLVVEAGSVLEDDDQQGLAHYLEHMAFNGTKNYKKQELVDFLESIGMGFGSHLNAYTSFDETVYMLQVPTEDPAVVKQSFQILEDWAHQITLDDEEIEKERGVIIEEWRGRRGASQRIQEQQLPVLLHGSKYATRLPIGKKKVLETFEFDRMRDFYNDWYRPDLMSIIAVGTLDKDTVEAMIHEQFGDLPRPAGKPERTRFQVPEHEETLAIMVTDPETSSSSVDLIFKHPGETVKTYGDYRRSITESMAFNILNQRLAELTQQADPPFLGAGAFNQNFVPSRKFIGFSANVKEGGHVKGLDAVLTEVERARRHGFTKGELDRQKTNMLRSIEQGYRERDKNRSRTYAQRYIKTATEGSVSVGIEKAKELYEQIIPTIKLKDINALVDDWITEDNRVISADGPEKEGVDLPSEKELLNLLDVVAKRDIAPYEENLADAPLVKKAPPAGKIVKRETRDDIGTTTWTLSNGARVTYKVTDFKADEIRFTAFSEGGSSLAEDDNYESASMASSMAQIGGVSDYSRIDLGKKLAGKVASASPYISSSYEGFSGSCSPQDIELMFELMTAYRNHPRKDDEAFASLQTRQLAGLENRLAQPTAVFSDEVTRILGQNHPRRQPPSAERVKKVKLDPALAFYKERFANPGGFSYIFVGNLDPKQLEALVIKYLGGGKPDTETWRDEGVRRPFGAVSKTVKMGLEQKAQVYLMWWGEFDWGYPNRHALSSMAAVLNIKLRERIREELGGTYSISASGSSSRIPKPRYSINVGFGCKPEEVDTLIAAVMEEIEAMKTKPVEQSYVDKIKEKQIRAHEVNLKENNFWLSQLSFAERHTEDPSIILQQPGFSKALTAEAIQKAAKKYFATENTGTFLLLPEDTPEGGEKKKEANKKDDK